MKTHDLESTIGALMAHGKGILAADESHGTIARRFVDVLVESGIVPGIKVDRGAMPLAGAPGERITEGLGWPARAAG